VLPKTKHNISNLHLGKGSATEAQLPRAHPRPVLILGIETSCDETGVALYDTAAGLLGDALHSQADLHARYGGVVPELASRDHVRHLVPLAASVLAQAQRRMARSWWAPPLRPASVSPSAVPWSASIISKATCCRR